MGRRLKNKYFDQISFVFSYLNARANISLKTYKRPRFSMIIQCNVFIDRKLLFTFYINNYICTDNQQFVGDKRKNKNKQPQHCINVVNTINNFILLLNTGIRVCNFMIIILNKNKNKCSRNWNWLWAMYWRRHSWNLPRKRRVYLSVNMLAHDFQSKVIMNDEMSLDMNFFWDRMH